MIRTFTNVLDVVLREEGGFACDPKDPGGMTNLGVTAAQWRKWTQAPATEAVMRSLRRVDVQPFYKATFWDAMACDKLPIALALVLFDFGVNEGPATAVKLLQGVAGASKDGQIGPATLRALQAYITTIGLPKLITRLCDAQADHYRALPTFPRFGKGWLGRVADVQKEALAWI